MKLTGILAMFILLLTFGCTESTSIGGEILNQDQASLIVIDTFTILTATNVEDQQIAYSPSTQFSNYPCGHFSDPVFGEVQADFYAQYRINQNALPRFDTSLLVFDSLVLRLDYDETGYYGDTLATQQYEVFRIVEDEIKSDSTYFDDQEFAIADDPVGSATFVPDFADSVDIKVGNNVVAFAPQLAIRLEDDLGMELMNYSDDQDQNNDDFLSNFGGLVVKSVGGPTAAMPSFNILSASTALVLHFHAKDNDTTALQYIYDITANSVRFSSLDNQSSSVVSTAKTGGFAAGEDLLYLQALNGPDILLKLPYITSFKDQIAVNNAELSFTIQMQSDEDLYPSPEQLILVYKNDNGTLVTIDDVIFTFSGLGREVFGGQPEEFLTADGLVLRRYRMNIAGHLQRMIDDGDEIPNELHLRVFQKTQKASRAILYGSDHPDYPVTLKANFTFLN